MSRYSPWAQPTPGPSPLLIQVVDNASSFWDSPAFAVLGPLLGGLLVPWFATSSARRSDRVVDARQWDEFTLDALVAIKAEIPRIRKIADVNPADHYHLGTARAGMGTAFMVVESEVERMSIVAPHARTQANALLKTLREILDPATDQQINFKAIGRIDREADALESAVIAQLGVKRRSAR